MKSERKRERGVCEGGLRCVRNLCYFIYKSPLCLILTQEHEMLHKLSVKTITTAKQTKSCQAKTTKNSGVAK